MKNLTHFIEEITFQTDRSLSTAKTERSYFERSEASHSSGALSVIKGDILQYLAKDLKETLVACAQYNDDENTVKHIKEFVKTNREYMIVFARYTNTDFDKTFYEIKREIYETFLNSIESNFYMLEDYIKPNDTHQKPVSPWQVVEGHCATRTLNGERVAFIEKTPRVKHPESGEWIAGPKGEGGNGPDVNGGYQPSRDWCDAKLVELGYHLP